MSSMLKKTTGLGKFKPKVGPRRPGSGPSTAAGSERAGEQTVQAASSTQSPSAPTTTGQVGPEPHESSGSRQAAEEEGASVNISRSLPTPTNIGDDATELRTASRPEQETEEEVVALPSTQAPSESTNTTNPSVEPPSQITASSEPAVTPPTISKPSNSSSVSRIEVPPRSTEAGTQPVPAVSGSLVSVGSHSLPGDTAPNDQSQTSSTVPGSTRQRKAPETGDAPPKKKRTSKTRQSRKKLPSAPSARTTRAVQSGHSEPTGVDGQAGQTSDTEQASPAEGASLEGQDAETASHGGDAVASQVQPKKKGRSTRRQPTPENAENIALDRKTTKIRDLTQDMGIGKPFKHKEVIEERWRQNRAAVAKRKKDRLALLKGALSASQGENANGSRAGTPPGGSATADQAAQGAADVPIVGYEIIDGQIVVNQSSLMVDRHAEQDAANLETVEEDQFSHLTNSNSYKTLRNTGPNHWSEAETERFFYLLRQWGTDFETISQQIPGKTRRMVKCKFNREEKARPLRINHALGVGSKNMTLDLEEYKKERNVGGEWMEKEQIEAEQALLKETHDAEVEKLRSQRRELGLLDDDQENPARVGKEAGSAAATSSAAAKGKRKRRPTPPPEEIYALDEPIPGGF